ncbi:MULTISPECIES: deoxyguanosinetriphosphate triphosphohydrolase [unclassified Thioalkalivibrio]|uniref:deoxyguanosinetriphosphate triphosphohydrolase n=1 Tax=unclassified Thioalkalivibrio TaxID=2621013 RepID=UPI0003658157|nr:MULTISPECIES: deoxyguanosinetriphosphate triphosphohydrolase [unclassified Thioalkalivibrio]PYG04237.1 dGTPase [Thioalkalivibrio sp. ALE21]
MPPETASIARTPNGVGLAPWAADPERTRGRRHPEDAPRHRSEFQRDRDRIVHSSAFRRLEYKTQVFISHEGDLFRNRLTHSLEVAQIGRSVARALGLNEDLTEAVALAHDLGHTPFGHTGQHALNDCMREHGGFEHNLQSLRIVDHLEAHYADFDGLNLTFETREGILKHCSPEDARILGEVGVRFLQRGQPSLEAQLANVADEIAYNNHDVDDGLRAGLLQLDQLMEVPLFRDCLDAVRARYPRLEARRVQHETVRRMIDTLVQDLVTTSRHAIESSSPESIDAVRAESGPLIRFSPEMAERNRTLKTFLRENLYRHHQVHGVMHKARQIILDLFAAFDRDPRLMPEHYQRHARALSEDDPHGQQRAIADYIAGMTDRHAIREHHRLFDLGTLT